MGSKSDMPVMERAGEELEERGIRYEMRVMSAHRDPETVAEYAKNARMRGLRVIIAGAGLAAALPGRGGRAHRPAGDRRAAHLEDLGRRAGSTRCWRSRRCRRACRWRAWAWTTRANAAVLAARILRRLRDRALHPPRDGRGLVRAAQAGDLAAGGGGRRSRRSPSRAWCPATTLEAIRERATFTVEAVKEREQVTDHDVAAFVDVVAESVGEAGRWIHYGLTSSDVLDTALALQLREAGRSCSWRARGDYRDALVRRAREHVDTLCVGRTHGVHAEPTTFGVKLAGFAFEAHRNLRRLERAFEQACGGRALGRGRHLRRQRPRVRAARARAARPAPRARSPPRSSPRDRHAELLQAIALAGAGLERFATEIRHLQRTEVREVEEPFRAGPEGLVARCRTSATRSTSERITGLARLLRGYAQAGARERGALARARHLALVASSAWSLPDATILLDYVQHLARARRARA